MQAQELHIRLSVLAALTAGQKSGLQVVGHSCVKCLQHRSVLASGVCPFTPLQLPKRILTVLVHIPPAYSHPAGQIECVSEVVCC